MKRILGLDIGDKSIWVALSDPIGVLASPLIIVERFTEEADVAAITSLIKQYHVTKVIAGLPRSMDGSLGYQAEKVENFVARLVGQTETPVEFRDERLSTVSAQRLMREAGAKKRRQQKHDDAIAAAVILQGYLDETLSV